VKRICHLLYPEGSNGASTLLFAAAILVATTVGAFAAWPPEPVQRISATTQRQMDRAEMSPYNRWLNEEVVYIITDEERAAFQKLTSDGERDKFVEQFWERRNPNPGSARNEGKEEHYRRIAYANEHFATSRPGWQTDRGRIYIVYGPPDEIEVHPKGEHSTCARETWIYRHVGGIGDNVSVTFVDRAGTRDYRLAPGKVR
jgi:GWxTD domain-containing protein